jgi:hypothetical protein
VLVASAARSPRQGKEFQHKSTRHAAAQSNSCALVSGDGKAGDCRLDGADALGYRASTNRPLFVIFDLAQPPAWRVGVLEAKKAKFSNGRYGWRFGNEKIAHMRDLYGLLAWKYGEREISGPATL